jgi:hypothetical protein
MSYSYIDEKEVKKRHGGTASSALAQAMAPTEMMPAIPNNWGEASLPTETTVQKIVSEICERDIAAWTCLPKSLRDEMLLKPSDFRLISNKAITNDIPHIRYREIEMKWNGSDSWIVIGLVK